MNATWIDTALFSPGSRTSGRTPPWPATVADDRRSVLATRKLGVVPFDGA